jgi:hypothetical protein
MTFHPTIRNQQDLHDAWHVLMSPLGFSTTSTWFMLIDADGRPVPHVTQIEDDGRPPTSDQLAGLVDLLGELCDMDAPGGRVAFLRSRPGHAGLTADDRAWARTLYEVGRAAGLPLEVVHRACDVDLVPIPMDEVLAESVA